jgi:hypothetical protein
MNHINPTGEFMQVYRIITIAITGVTISIALAAPSMATPKQYQAGYRAGVAVGKESGRMDGSGEAGTNAMHTNASCSIEHPKNKDYDRGYDRGCRTTYEQTFIRSYKNRKPKK